MSENPFPGLRPFEPDEDYLYFGRERQIDELLARLRDTRFLSVVGASGSGKSSLVRAGLVPSLHSGFMVGAGSSWRVAILRPGSDPIGNLAEALDEPAVLGRPDELGEANRMMLEAALRSSSRGLAECVRRAHLPTTENVLVVVDQFEELFRLRDSAGSSWDESVAFVKLLLTAAQEDVPLYVVLTMRSDFIGDCMDFPGLPEAINRGQYLVPRLTRDDLRLAVTGPAGVRGAKMSPRLVATLLNDLEEDQDQLPVLQHALMRVWDYWERHAAEGDEISVAHYEAIGTMTEALSRHAETTYDSLETDERREIAKRLFKALTDTDRDGRGIRRPARVAEIVALTGADESEVIEVVDRFRAPGRSFLMPPHEVPLDGDSVIDLSHESLMRNWETLVRWAGEEAESAELYRRLSEAAKLKEKKQAGLWGRPELDIGLDWRDKNEPTEAWGRRYDPAFERAMGFLDASRRARTNRRLIRGGIALVVGVTIFLLAGSIFLETRKKAFENQLRAVLLIQDPLVRNLLLAELGERGVSDQALGVFQQVAAARIPLTSFGGQSRKLVGAAFAADGEDGEEIATLSEDGWLERRSSDGKGATREIGKPHADDVEVIDVAFSGDGRRLIAAFEDGSVRTGPSDGPLWPVEVGSDESVDDLAMDPEGTRVAIASGKEIRVWSVNRAKQSVREPVVLKGRKGSVKASVTDVAFDGSGRQLVAAYWDGRVRIWNLDSPASPSAVIRIDDGPEQERVVAFSADGRWVICSHGEIARIYSSDGRGAPTLLAGHEGPLKSVAFSPDGLRVLTTAKDHTARIWDLRKKGRSLELVGSRATLWSPERVVNDAAFNEDGSRLVTLTTDGAARIWPSDPGEPRILDEHPKRVESIAFGPKDRHLVAASGKTAWIRSLDGSGAVELKGHPKRVRDVAFSASGERVATCSKDGVRIWSLDGEPLMYLPSGDVVSLDFHPEEEDQIVAMGRKKISIWNLDYAAGKASREREIDRELERVNFRNWFESVAFSPDGSAIVTASADGIAHVWNSATGAIDREISGEHGHGEKIWSAAFDSKESRIVTASADHTARVWEEEDDEPDLLLRHDDEVLDASFSRDGRWLATASSDKTVRIWSTENEGPELLVLRHESPVRSVAFNQDRSLLATGTGTGTKAGVVRLWRISWPALTKYTTQEASTACLTPAQRRRYLEESDSSTRFEECESRHGRSAPSG